MQQYVDFVTSRSGAAISGASVLVKTYPAGANATIYSDDGVTAASNPLTTDANGQFAFYAADGRYTLVISKTGVIDQRTLTDAVHLWDPDDGTAEQDAADVAFTQSGSGAIARTVQAKGREWVSVEDFGGVVDGVTDDTAAWVLALATGKHVTCHGNTVISTITLSTNFQTVDIYGNLLITGAGVVMNARSAKFRVTGKVYTSTGVAVVGGALSPAPSVACAFNMKSDKMTVDVGKIDGFVDGVLYEDGQNAPDCYVRGNIELCTTAINIKNTTGTEKHEGQKIDCTIFNCNTGVKIAANCQLQRIMGVVDNANITGSKDIDDSSGHHLIWCDFVRPEPNSTFGNGCILQVLTGTTYLRVMGYDGTGDVKIDPSNGVIELTAANPAIDFKNSSSEDFDGRLQLDETLNAAQFKVTGPTPTRAYYPFYTSSVRLFDDFLGDALASHWNSVLGSNAQCAIAISQAKRGMVRLTTGNDAAATMAVNGVQLDQGLMQWSADLGSFYAEFRVKMDAITNICVFVGFTDQVTLEMPFTLGAGDALTSNATDAFGVLFDTAADTDNWHAVGVKADVDATRQNLAVAPSAATYETWGFEMTAAGAVTFYRNGAAIGSAMSNAVTASTPLTPVVAAFSRNAASRAVDVDLVLVQGNRGASV